MLKDNMQMLSKEIDIEPVVSLKRNLKKKATGKST